MKKAILLLTFHFSLFTTLYLSAQHYSFRNYTVADGLGSSSINHIFQDSKGYIWFATQGGGASKFNGKEFTTYTTHDGLINNDVTYITEDKTGNIWIATATGVSVFNGSNFTNYNLTGGVVYCIYADAQSKIWFATADSGIMFSGLSETNKKGLSPISFTRSIGSVAGMPTSETYTISEDKSGNYYFGTGDGIVKYHQGKVSVVGNNLSGKTFFSSTTDAAGNVWFGSATGDVIVIQQNQTIEKIKLPAEVEHAFIGGITQDKQNNVWIATEHGLVKLSPPITLSGVEGSGEQGGMLFTNQQGLSVNTVQTVLCDYENNIWAGTLTGGANLLSSEAFVHYTQPDGLTTRNITALCSDATGNITYIGTEEGLFLATGNKFQKATISELSHINISSISIAGNGLIWIASSEAVYVAEKYGTGLRVKKKYAEIAGTKLVSPQKIIHDSKGNTWVATYGSGVFLLNSAGEKVYDTQHHFPSDNILTVFEDQQLNILFGTQDKGLIKFDGKSFPSPVTLSRGEASGGVSDRVPPTALAVEQEWVSNVGIWSIAQDNTGTLFLGTGESGLCIYSHGKTKWLTTKNGVSSDYIPVLYYDTTQQCLWLAGEKGLDKITFNADYSIKQIHTYKEPDGFSSVAINANAIACNKTGNLWLGTVNGLWQYRSQYDLPHQSAPKIQLTNIRLFYGKEDVKQYYTNGNTLNLPYNKNHLTFSIRALTTGNVNYTFKLEGQDADWSVPTPNNEITYSNITPGNRYTFRAKAITGNSVESTETVSFTFTVNAPWWKTWWFYLLSAITITGGLFLFIKTRERLLREQNIKLEATVKQRTHVIEEQKQTVEKMLGEKELLLKEIHHRVKNNLQTISSMLMLQSMELKDEEAKKAITESQSRVRSIALVHQKLYQTDGLEKVELKGFVAELTTQVKSLYQSEARNISINIQMPEIYILIDKAIPLGLILNELITNSLKYAFAQTATGEIKIEASVIQTESKSRKVKLTYCDNGKGFDYEKLSETSSTLGIELIKLLSEQIGATLNYSNKQGSEFVFIFGINI